MQSRTLDSSDVGRNVRAEHFPPKLGILPNLAEPLDLFMACTSCGRNALAPSISSSSILIDLQSWLLPLRPSRTTRGCRALGTLVHTTSYLPRTKKATKGNSKHLLTQQPKDLDPQRRSHSLSTKRHKPKTHDGLVQARPRSNLRDQYQVQRNSNYGKISHKRLLTQASSPSSHLMRNGLKNSWSYEPSHGKGSGRIQRVKGRTPTSKITEIHKEREPWQVQKAALSKKFGSSGWLPRKRLSPDALDGIRRLHAEDPDTYDTATLAAQFEVSPEAIRRILKSKWRPTEEEEDKRRARWERRGQRIWSSMSELGVRPPKKWRQNSNSASERLGTVTGSKQDPIPLSERIL